jgi:membrane fusion protein (multidrug efflux system)
VTVPFLALLAACSGADPAPEATATDVPTNRIHAPSEVVANLGITFRKAEQGRLELHMEVPGRLEVPEDRRWILRAPAAGRVRLGKERWARVRAGERIGELISDELRAVQNAMYESSNALLQAERALEQARAAVAPRKALAETLKESVHATRQRVSESETVAEQAKEVRAAARQRLAEVQRLRSENAISGKEFLAAQHESLEAETAVLDAHRRVQEGRVALRELEQRTSEAQADVATFHKSLEVLENRLKASRLAYLHKLRELAALTGISESELSKDDSWARLQSIGLTSPSDGVLVNLHTAGGEWVDGHAALAEVLDLSVLVFRGEVPEGDLARLPPGAPVRVVSPVGAFKDVDTKLRGPLPLADPDTRTVRVEARVPNPDRLLPRGVSALARVLVDRGQHEEVLVPAECVVQDQLEFLVFRRDPANAEYVIRTPIAMGRRTPERVEVLSGVAAGDELVAHGIHQLKQTGIGRPSAKGHFHADGSWHAGDG